MGGGVDRPGYMTAGALMGAVSTSITAWAVVWAVVVTVLVLVLARVLPAPWLVGAVTLFGVALLVFVLTVRF